jgi:hypothetical protein
MCARGAILVVLVSVALSAAAIWFGQGREIEAPPWLQKTVVDRIEAALPGQGADFGSVRVKFDLKQGLVLTLRDVTLLGRSKRPLVEFSYIEASLAPSALLKGRSGLHALTLSGIAISIRRDGDGHLGLAYEESVLEDVPRPSLAQILLALDGVLVHPNFDELEMVQIDAVTVQYEDYLAERAWTVDGGRVVLERFGQTLDVRGDFVLLTGRADVATVALSAKRQIGTETLSLALSVDGIPSQEIATQSAALAWLGAVQAPISGSFRADVFSDGSLNTLNATLQIGKGVVQPTSGAAPLPFNRAGSYFSFDAATQTLQFDEMTVEADWGKAALTGTMVLEGAGNGAQPTGMLGQLTLTQLELASQEGFSEGMELDHVEIDLHLGLAPFVLRLGRIWVDNPDVQVYASGHLAAKDDGWSVAIDGRVPSINYEAIKRYWPSELRPKMRRWMVNRVETARVENGQFALRLEPGQALRRYADFEVHDAVIHYFETLPSLYDMHGHVTVDNNRSVTDVHSGYMVPDGLGRIDFAGSRLTVDDIRIKPSVGRFDFLARGDIVPMLAGLDRPPMRALSRANVPVELGSGTGELTGWLEFPFKKGLKKPDFSWDVRADLRDVVTDKLIPGRLLTATQLTLRSTQADVAVKGQARLDDVPMTGSWRLSLLDKGEPSVLLAQVPVGPDTAKKLGIKLPDGMFSGAAVGALRVEIDGKSPPQFALTSDLEGLSARIDPLGFRFGAAESGRLAVSGSFSNPVKVTSLSIDAGSLSATGDLSVRLGGDLERLDFTDFMIEPWLSGRVSLIGRDGTSVPAIILENAVIDLRNAPRGIGDLAGEGRVGGSTGGSLDSLGPISIDVQKFYLTDSIALTDLSGNFTANGALRGAFRARLNGGPKLEGTAVPTADGTALILQTNDAGAVFKAAGLFGNARGGDMEIRMQPRPEGGYLGTMSARQVRLRDSPAFASLLDAISIVGLIDQLDGPGIIFNTVDARFRLTPDRIILEQSSATGPSMGVSLDGYYYPKTKRLDLQGVLSPLYVVNGIGQIFTRRGEGLVGFNFNIRGTADRPSVMVNPLSLFTPGMFREIFRRPPPTPSN